jgi:GYF domain 2
MDQWYYAHKGQQHGPVSDADMRQRVAAGQVLGTDLVWKKGMTDWVESRQVAELWPERVAPVPSLKPPTSSAKKWGQSEPPGFYAPAGLSWDQVDDHLRRVIVWDLQSIELLPEERSQLGAAGVADGTVQRYAVWRRSVLLVAAAATGLAAFFSLINVFIVMGRPGQAGVAFLYLLLFVGIAAAAATAFMASRRYTQIWSSHRLLLIGGAVAALAPIVVNLIPAQWWVTNVLNPGTLMGNRIELSLGMFFGLMAVVLAIAPGVCGACLRLKTLLPASLIPGWGLVIVGPLFALLGLGAFILFYHVFGNIFLMAGFLALVAAPLVYLLHFQLLTRPLGRGEDISPLGKAQQYALIGVGGGVALILLGMLTTSVPVELTVPDNKVLTRSLLGFTQRHSYVTVWSLDLHLFWTQVIGLALFSTVLFADLGLRMNSSIWRQERGFARTRDGADYDQTMAALSDLMEPPPVEMAPRSAAAPVEVQGHPS